MQPIVQPIVKSAFVALAVCGAALGAASAALTPDAPAPAFTGVTSNGETISLSDFAGKTVVLEWTNDGCPFVQKHYASGNMQRLQKEAAAEGVVWISVISSAPGQQGYADGARANELTEAHDAAPAHVALDPDGIIGRAYGAKTTPHMFVIDGDGVLRFEGGIDDKPSTDPATIETATNYVTAALDDLAAGREVAVKAARPYGCSVKYAH